MNAYILELLYPTGWRRACNLHWRYADATEAASTAVNQSGARAARVLPVSVHDSDVFRVERHERSAINSLMPDTSNRPTSADMEGFRDE